MRTSIVLLALTKLSKKILYVMTFYLGFVRVRHHRQEEDGLPQPERHPVEASHLHRQLRVARSPRLKF